MVQQDECRKGVSDPTGQVPYKREWSNKASVIKAKMVQWDEYRKGVSDESTFIKARELQGELFGCVRFVKSKVWVFKQAKTHDQPGFKY